MGKFISSYFCECNEDCKQGLSGKNTWSKPDAQPQMGQPLIAQESAVKVDAQSPPPNGGEALPKLPENFEVSSTFGSSASQPVDDVAAAAAKKSLPKPEAEERPQKPDAEDRPPKPDLLDPDAPSQLDLQAVHVPTDSTAVPSDSTPSDKPSVNPVFRFDVAVAKEAGEGYGFAHASVEDSSNTLMIVALRDQGPIARWNEARRKGDEKTVRRGDRIVAVGGIYDDADAMRTKLRQDSAVLTLERWPHTIVIALVKRSPADKYGLSTQRFQREDGAAVLQVTQIEEGLMSEWNSEACESRRFHEIVRPTYDIVKLDELVDNPEKMQEALMVRDSIEITFNRPDTPSMFDK